MQELRPRKAVIIPQSGGIGERCRSRVTGRHKVSRDVARRSRKIAIMSQECREMSQKCRHVVACRPRSLEFTKRQQLRQLRSTLRQYNRIPPDWGVSVVVRVNNKRSRCLKSVFGSHSCTWVDFNRLAGGWRHGKAWVLHLSGHVDNSKSLYSCTPS